MLYFGTLLALALRLASASASSIDEFTGPLPMPPPVVAAEPLAPTPKSLAKRQLLDSLLSGLSGLLSGGGSSSFASGLGNLASTFSSYGNPRQTNWGPYVDLGVLDSSFIKMTSIYSPGKPTRPDLMKGTIFLWPGVWDQKDRNRADLIQSVVELYDPAKTRMTCGAKGGEWCVRPFVVNYSSREVSSYPRVGKVVGPDDKLFIEYEKGPGANGNWTQRITNLSRNNEVLFTYVRGYKQANYMRLATEYQYGNTVGTSDTQQYWNVTMTLDSAEPRLPRKLKVTGQIKCDPLRTTDGGKTWIIDYVSIPAKSPGTAWSPS